MSANPTPERIAEIRAALLTGSLDSYKRETLMAMVAQLLAALDARDAEVVRLCGLVREAAFTHGDPCPGGSCDFKARALEELTYGKETPHAR